MGTGAAQALLPLVQLRIASCRHRQRPEHLALRSAQFPARRCLSVLVCGLSRAGTGAGGAAVADFRHALALGCESRPGTTAFSWRQESATTNPAHALRRLDGF